MRKESIVKILIFSIVIIFLILLCVRIIPSRKVAIDWIVVSAIATWAGVVVTILVHLIKYLIRNKTTPIVHFIGFSLIENSPHLAITNEGEKPFTISQISFNFGKYSLGRINAEDYKDIGSVIMTHITVKPHKLTNIKIPIVLFQSQIAEFHCGDEEIWNDFLKKIRKKQLKITIRDITGKYYHTATTTSLNEYLDIVMDR